MFVLATIIMVTLLKLFPVCNQMLSKRIFQFKIVSKYLLIVYMLINALDNGILKNKP